MNAVLRRYYKKNGEGEVLKVGKVTLDLSKHRVEVGGDAVKLTGKEFGLLEVMMKKSGRVLSRQFLLEYVWGYEEEVLTRTIDMHIARLRQKLEDDPAQPQGDAQIEEKFRGFTEDLLGTKRVSALLDRLWHLEDYGNVAEIPPAFVLG